MNKSKSNDGGVNSWRKKAAGQFESWMKPDISGWSSEKQEQYTNKLRAVELYCGGESLRNIQ